MPDRISGVILAGGDNRRFDGKTKSNIVIDGKTIISRIIETIRDLFDEIIIVTNTPAEFEEHNKYKLIGDQFVKAGPLGGIHAALKAASNESIFVFAGDMPLIDKRLIVNQIDCYYNNICDALVPGINDFIEPLHAIYKVTILSTLEEYLTGENDYAVREFIKNLNVVYLQFEESEEIRNTFLNVNSPSDISVIEKILGIC